MSASIPEGFAPVNEPGTFLGDIGGIHWRFTDAGAESCVIVEKTHTNPLGVAHGGFLMTLLDITLGAAAHNLLRGAGVAAFPLTVQHSCSFIGGAREGALLRGEGRIDAATKTLVYASGRLSVEERIIATGVAVYRLPRADSQG